MASINMAEKSMIFNYILLTSQIAIELEDVSKGKKLTEQQYQLFNEGAKLLSKIIEGATLVEGKQFKNGLVPTLEGLSMYGYALSTIEKFEKIGQINQFTEFFENLKNEMNKLIKQKNIAETEIKILKKFFYFLGYSLKGDVQKENYQKETILTSSKKRQMNEYLYA